MNFALHEMTSNLDCTSTSSTLSPESVTSITSIGGAWEKNLVSLHQKQENQIKYLNIELEISQKEAEICLSMVSERDRLLQKRDADLVDARKTIEILLRELSFRSYGSKALSDYNRISLKDFQTALEKAFKGVVVCNDCKVKHRKHGEILFSVGKSKHTTPDVFK